MFRFGSGRYYACIEFPIVAVRWQHLSTAKSWGFLLSGVRCLYMSLSGRVSVRVEFFVCLGGLVFQVFVMLGLVV